MSYGDLWLLLMKAVRLHGPEDLRVEELAAPGAPAAGQVKIRVKAVGLCGSDMHMYGTGAIGGESIAMPLIMGHEFMGEILELGADAKSGMHGKLEVGQRVAVEPASPCMKCECCEEGHPNLCPNHSFNGVYPTDGALCEEMLVKSRNCFPIPYELSDAEGTLLETLGVAIHAVDLGKLKVAKSVAIVGCGPVGLLILKLAKLAGAGPVYVFDRHDWRVEQAKAWGADEAAVVDEEGGAALLDDWTDHRGADVVFEVAWADESVQQSAEMCRYGGRLVLVGIPADNNLTMQHGTARRKGLTIMMARRMKHTYPRAIRLASGDDPAVPLDEIVSEEFPIEETPAAYAKNYAYERGVQKIVITI